ncbi:hypothetical protein [Pseudomonas soli]|uniref:hypothetical protein n=1 Tax=Pseudomonas soli TaxID=1306993 RepID=UPI00380E7D4E
MIKSVYRFIKSEVHADQLARGEIYISTLETCRGFEDPQRGDKEEGYERYFNKGTISGGGSNSEFVYQANQLGMLIGPDATGITIVGGERLTKLHDSYVLCTTMGFSRESLTESFGKYCVEIFDVDGFAKVVTQCLYDRGFVFKEPQGQ